MINNSSSFIATLIVAILYFVLALTSFCANVMLTIVFFVGHRYFSQKPFYIVARHLLVADFCLLLPQFSISVVMASLPLEITKGNLSD